MRGEINMTRVTYLLLPAVCALAFTLGTPAMALNPQPLPPGFKHQPTSFHASRFTASNRIWSGLKCPKCASTQHMPD
jgi:hypothetical protein